MIGSHHDQRAIELAGAAEAVEKPAQHRIGIRHLGVVRLVQRGVRLRGSVRFVRIVEMDPGKPRGRGIRDSGFGIRDPGQGGPDDILGSPLRAFGGLQPRIAPDGNTIAFSYQGSLWRMPRAGGTMTRLTDGPGFDIEPVWSPDGKRIAFVNSTNTLGGNLRLINANDGRPVPLPKNVQVRGTILYYKLEFHPGGGKVLGVFQEGGKDWGLAWFDLDTGELKSVATLPAWARFTLSPDGFTKPPYIAA